MKCFFKSSLQSNKEDPPFTDRNSNNAPSTARFTQSPPLPPITRRTEPKGQSPEVSPRAHSPTVTPRPREDKEQSPKVSPVQVSYSTTYSLDMFNYTRHFTSKLNHSCWNSYKAYKRSDFTKQFHSFSECVDST